jgi:CubicO group peptidase (beta-lactamase class C family)
MKTRLQAVFFLCFAWFISLQALADGTAVTPGEHWSKVPATDAAGWSDEKLSNADNFANSIATQSYLIVQHGKIVHSYGDITKPTEIYSMRKSVLSILFGKYVGAGVINLDKTLAQLHITDKGGLTEKELQATVRQLMQARSGVYHPAAYETPAMAASRPARGSFNPGEHWYYNNWDFNTLGAIFTQFTGKPVFDAVRDDLAVPMQFEDFHVSDDTRLVYEDNSDYPAYTMRMSARDLARVGWLMAQNGKWNGHQIVSADWVDQSTTAYSTVMPGVGYGYMWWVGIRGVTLGNHFSGPVYSARGNYGQYIVVVPDLELVIVHKFDHDARRSAGARESDSEVSHQQFGKLLALIMASRLPEPTIKNLAMR